MLFPLIFCAPNIPKNNRLPKRNKDFFAVQRRFMTHVTNMNEINNLNNSLSNENPHIQRNLYKNYENNIMGSGISKKLYRNGVRSERGEILMAY